MQPYDASRYLKNDALTRKNYYTLYILFPNLHIILLLCTTIDLISNERKTMTYYDKIGFTSKFRTAFRE